MATQPELFTYVQPIRPVNVATVAQLSPFRYAGGKTWFMPVLRRWLLFIMPKPSVFYEPFAGGAIASLTVANEHLCTRAVMVELDEQVAAVWSTILGVEQNSKWLADQIVQFDLNSDNVHQVLDAAPTTRREQAFQTIVKNRVNRGGILAPGAGLIRNGEGSKGLRSRWYPQTLQKRILHIMTLRNQLTFIEGDGIDRLEQSIEESSAVYFIDPPYTASQRGAGARLYKYHVVDHARLFAITARLARNFLMTYEDAPEVRQLARQHHFETRSISMKNTHHQTKKELMIARDFAWYDDNL